MNIYPNENYRYVLKEGMSGWDVQTIQIAFISTPAKYNLKLDGDFGPITEYVAKTIQHNLGITVDGIVGPQTQSSLCARECESVKNLVPAGLIKGMCFGESGGIIPTTSSVYQNGSRDYGPLQDNMLDPSQAQLENAYSPILQAYRVAKQINSAYSDFLGQPGADSDEEAWRLAVLNYNWPAAAQKIAAGEGETWVYNSEGKQYKMSSPASWIEKFGITGVSTGWQWAEHYINSKIIFVKSWSIT